LSEDRPIHAAPAGTYQESDIRGGVDGADNDDGAAAATEFPPGEHPLEGVANLASLPAPKDITGLQRLLILKAS
jgi:hypothetical protein